MFRIINLRSESIHSVYSRLSNALDELEMLNTDFCILRDDGSFIPFQYVSEVCDLSQDEQDFYTMRVTDICNKIIV